MEALSSGRNRVHGLSALKEEKEEEEEEEEAAKEERDRGKKVQ